ncbi:hypothetical protein K2173_025068 [Erythroxylum novogranatense]|uniref:XS domain-containing protein n=1 Tax=Erythroxylum novogranatense TaxID=1862640 RepID=A0AAV8SW72_9ROSI|nr:hypothetical protein K2173_025068 [Erythroxylum novogranatense]
MESGRDSYSISHRRDVFERRSPPRVRRRSLSPRPRMDVSRRVELREGRLSSKGRDCSWYLGGGKNEKVQSGSPLYHVERKRSHFDEKFGHRERDYVEDIDYDDGKRNRLKQVYAYEHHSAYPRISKERDRNGKRVSSIYGHEMMGHKSAPVEVGMARESYQISPDLVPTSDYEQIGGHLRLPSWSTQINSIENEKLQYRDPMPSDKTAMRETYEIWEKPEFHMDLSYGKVPASHNKDFESAAHYFSSTNLGVSRSEFPISCKESLPLPTSDDVPRTSVKFMEPMQYTNHGQISAIDMRRLEGGKSIETDFTLGMYSPENDAYHYPKVQGIINDNVYVSDDLHRTKNFPPHSWVDYEHSEMDNERRELSRTNVMHPLLDKADQNENSLGNMRKNSVWYRPIKQKQVDTKGFDSSRTSYTSKHDGDYLSSGYPQIEFTRRESQENEATHSGFKPDYQASHLRPNHAFVREPNPQLQKERLQDPLCMYDFEMQGLARRRLRMKEEMTTYEPPDEVLKRNYLMDEDTGKQDFRAVTSRKWKLSEELEGFCDHEEWNNNDTSILRASRTQRLDHRAYGKGKANDDDEDPAFQNFLSSQDYWRPALRNSVKHYKPTMKYIKGHPKPSSLRWHKSQKIDRSSIHKRQKSGKRIDDYFEDAHENDDAMPEDLMNSIDPDLVEDSEEFKQKVDEACLMYSKKLNWSLSVKRRYISQGKAGGLFCIVCGSSSKEFMGTRRLATHAFMSPKAGLRVQHLGLHKAICILMGWNSYVPLNTITWAPDVLSRAEALVQKENLILWPPVFIIHNISMSNNIPELQKVVPIEEVESFIRGKVVIGVKIKVCLGKPADQSVVLVKFLGTFTGLENAERLHRYFADHKHGREDFEQEASSGSRSSKSLEVGLQQDKLVEDLLYGYMGIAEDLDWLDFNSKKRILIKGKKEITELANAPVKNGDK